MILKTSQWFYKNKQSIKGCGSDEFIKIEKPGNKKKYKEYEDGKHSSATHLLEYSSHGKQMGIHPSIIEEAYTNENSSHISPTFFSDVHSSEFVSIPINIKHNDDEDQWSSFIDYHHEDIFKSGKQRQREYLFK